MLFIILQRTRLITQTQSCWRTPLLLSLQYVRFQKLSNENVLFLQQCESEALPCAQSCFLQTRSWVLTIKLLQFFIIFLFCNCFVNELFFFPSLLIKTRRGHVPSGVTCHQLDLNVGFTGASTIIIIDMIYISPFG